MDAILQQEMNTIKQQIQSIEKAQTEMTSLMNEMSVALMGSKVGKDGGLVRRIELLEEDNDNLRARMQEDNDRLRVRIEILERKEDKNAWKTAVLWAVAGVAGGALVPYVLGLLIHK